MTDVNKTYCGDPFAVPTHVKSLCCTPETDIMYVNYTFMYLCVYVWTYLFTGVPVSFHWDKLTKINTLSTIFSELNKLSRHWSTRAHTAWHILTKTTPTGTLANFNRKPIFPFRQFFFKILSPHCPLLSGNGPLWLENNKILPHFYWTKNFFQLLVLFQKRE